MSERMTGLSITRLFGDHNNADIPVFLQQFADMLHTDGKKPAALMQIEVDTDFPLRLLVGIPAKTLSREQRLLAEAFCGMILGKALGDTKDLWTSRPGWRPTNPHRVAAPLAESTLDVPWMKSLGVPKPVWERAVFASTGALSTENVSALRHRPHTLMRYLIWLSIFGFSDPYQFFTAADTPRTASRNP